MVIECTATEGADAEVSAIVTPASREVMLVAIDRLTPYKGNARTHSKKQIEQIAASIRRFGFVNPVLVMARSSPATGGSPPRNFWA